jgi:hypothetical protein
VPADDADTIKAGSGASPAATSLPWPYRCHSRPTTTSPCGRASASSSPSPSTMSCHGRREAEPLRSYTNGSGERSTDGTDPFSGDALLADPYLSWQAARQEPLLDDDRADAGLLDGMDHTPLAVGGGASPFQQEPRQSAGLAINPECLTVDGAGDGSADSGFAVLGDPFRHGAPGAPPVHPTRHPTMMPHHSNRCSIDWDLGTAAGMNWVTPTGNPVARGGPIDRGPKAAGRCPEPVPVTCRRSRRCGPPRMSGGRRRCRAARRPSSRSSTDGGRSGTAPRTGLGCGPGRDMT